MKLAKKLVLSGVALAACAATLSTSTYAWYVSNKVATITDGTGNTGTAGSDGSILLSWNNGEDSYFKSLAFTDANKTLTGATGTIQPGHWDGTTFYGIAADGQKGSSSTAYLSFSVYIKSGADVTVTPTVNVTTTPGTTQVWSVDGADAGLPTGAEKGKATGVDAKSALYVRQVNGTDISTKAVSGDLTGGDAHKYYKAVSGNEVWAKDDTITATGLSNITLTEDTPVQLTYYIYLDGADKDCFNSCAGQAITFDVKFEVAA